MWADWLFGHRKGVIWAIVLTVILSGAGLSNLAYTPDTRVFFDIDDPRMVSLSEFEQTFLPSHTITFGLTSEVSFLSDATVRSALSWLNTRVALMENIIRVDSLVNSSYSYGSADQVNIESYMDYICSPECDFNRVGVLSSPLVVRRLLSEDHKMAAVVGTFELHRDEAEKIYLLTEEARAIKVELENMYPGVQLYISGGIPMSQAFVDAGQKDSLGSFLTSAILIGVLLFIFLGGIRNTLIMLACGVGAVVISLGIGGWLGIELNPASSATPIVVLTLVIAATMHLFSHYLRLCDDRRGPAFAATTALNVNVIPIVLTSLTSAISLLSLLFVSSPPVRDIGLMSAIGVLAGGALAITLAPLLLDTESRSVDSKFNSLVQRVLNRYASGIERNNLVPASVGICLFVAGSGLLFLQIDDDFIGYFGEETEFRLSTEVQIENLVGPNHIEVSLSSPEKGIFDPGILEDIDALTRQIRSDEIVLSAISIADIQADLVRAFGEQGLSRVTKEAHAQFFLAYEMSLSTGESANSIVDMSRTRSHIPVFLGDGSAIEIRRLESQIYEWAESFEDLTITVTGENIPVAHLSSSNIPAVTKMIATSLLFTALLLAFVFKSLRIGVAVLLAISLPVVCGFGLWGWVSQSIGLAGAIVVAISLGVVIDDAIHLIYHQIRARNRSQSSWESTQTSIHRVGTPIFATTVLFVVGLSPLLYSDFELNVTIAGCTSAILVLSLLFDLGVLPKFLAWATDDIRETSNG